MQSATQTVPVSKKTLWAGRIISALAVLFLIFDSVIKVMSILRLEANHSARVSREPCFRDRDHRTRLPGGLCDSAHLGAWRDLTDRLSWRRSRYPRARRFGAVFGLLPDHYRRADLGRAILAR